MSSLSWLTHLGLLAALAPMAGLVLLTAGGASAETEPETLAAAVQAAGCPPAKVTPPFGVAPAQQLAPTPDGVDGERVIVTLNPDGTGAKAALCVGLLQGGDRPPYAKLATARRIVDAEVTPANFISEVDGTPYPVAPGVTALGVRVSSDVNTETVNAGGSTLYLFRRQGDRLRLIFEASVSDWDLDKLSGKTASNDRVVRIDNRLTGGFHDLIVAKRGYRRGLRFIWSGDRYRPATAPRSGN